MYKRVSVMHTVGAHHHGNWVPRRHVARSNRSSRFSPCQPMAMCWVLAIAVGIGACFLTAMIWITLK